ncbi:PREDICTED: uncharacterized protein LOC109173565 [Ipomoea nil]|uniref:uncharacterized protein LOC109173565 n=1 Tax=Ipomoea nil TaxID=35883 RepID=UPI000901FFE8|nr:PREDICTED: uncharacterized protein LOC109173565 [Ipomoea nil]
MDAFRGYHQIFIHPADEEKTAFLTPDGVYCYRVMPFRLKNAGATYTRMVARLFQDLLGKSMAAYVDDMLVKSREEAKHAEDLADCFQVMLRYNLQLNPKKCAFAVQGGKFLGYMVTKRGIEPNPEKVQAIIDMQPPSTVKDLQRLTGRLAALSRILSKAADRTIPFFKAMKKKEGFAWTAECQQSFEELKQYLSTPPVLSTPQVGEPLFLYLAASPRAVSSVLVREEERTQHPVNYVSRSLKATEARYTALEKIVYALVITVRKLAPYFQAHTVRVLTDQPLGSVLQNPTSSGRLVKWAVELTQYGIEYQPRPSIKGQALADFLVECTVGEGDKEGTMEDNPGEWWQMHADGAASRQHYGGRVMLITPEGFRLYYALSYLFPASNNEAEYEAVSGTCEAKNARMAQYKEKAIEMLSGFGMYEIEYIPRADNTKADILSKIALEGVPDHLVKICQKEELNRPSIEETTLEIRQVAVEEWDREKNPKMFWIDDIRRYKETWELLEDPGVAARVICRFSLPEHVVSDNSRQFDCQAFADFCCQHSIRHTKVSVAYPQANGQVENVNRTIVDGIRKKLENIGGNWTDELDRVLWAYRTTQRRATEESPFSLAYGFEAKVPIEVVEPTHRVRDYSDEENEENLRIEKNFFEERREVAYARMVEYQRAVKRYRDRRIRPRTFQVGDLVLRDRRASQPTKGGKFAIKWEGPYRIAAVVQAGTYKLETLEGKPVDRIWNVIHLKKFYQ